MEFKYKIIIGDWSSDGHGKSESFMFNTNYEKEDIRNAYLKFCEQSNIQLHGDGFFCQYEDNVLSEEDYDKLTQNGCDLSFLELDLDATGGVVEYYFLAEDVFRLFMAMVKVILLDFKYEIFRPEMLFPSSDFNIGGIGYGVFYG